MTDAPLFEPRGDALAAVELRGALIFRPMSLADLEIVVRNETRAYAFPWTPGHFADSVAGSDDCWIVLRDGEVIGHGILALGAGEAHVLNVCIARSEQGRGYGRDLVEHLLGRARELGASVVFLEVRPSNRVAVRLYETLGFREIGLRRSYYPAETGAEDARVMCLEMCLEVGRESGRGPGRPND